MPHGRTHVAEQIEVLDQVGKRHVVLRYGPRGASSIAAGEPSKDETSFAEYRLSTGKVVDRTGPETFRCADGRLEFKVR